MRGITNEWLKCLLTDIKQFNRINAVISSSLHVTYKVAQGSTLGPFLFLVCINGLHKTRINSHFYHFADDTNLLLIYKSKKNWKTYQP